MFDIFQYIFLRNAVQAAILASVIFGIVGTFVVMKRIVFISGGIAHASFGGVGLAFYLGFDPLLGALFFAVGSAFGVGYIGKETIRREDTAIGIIWAVGMAIGALFYYITPGYLPSARSFLFGNLLMLRRIDVLLLLSLLVAVLVIVFLFYRQLQAISFDGEFSKIVGINTDRFYFLLLLLISLSIVFLIKFVGVVLVIAMLSIPASIASLVTHDMRKIMAYSSALSLFFILIGLTLSSTWNTPSGPTIVVFSGLIFVVIILYQRIFG